MVEVDGVVFGRLVSGKLTIPLLDRNCMVEDQ
jgi:hypothetical protein